MKETLLIGHNFKLFWTGKPNMTQWDVFLLSNGHSHRTCQTRSLLSQIWQGESHFSQKRPLANVSSLASIKKCLKFPSNRKKCKKGFLANASTVKPVYNGGCYAEGCFLDNPLHWLTVMASDWPLFGGYSGLTVLGGIGKNCWVLAFA